MTAIRTHRIIDEAGVDSMLRAVVHGHATVVTGEDKHTLGEGDVLVIPSGVPHQFVDVPAPFFYFVTKVQS